MQMEKIDNCSIGLCKIGHNITNDIANCDNVITKVDIHLFYLNVCVFCAGLGLGSQ